MSILQSNFNSLSALIIIVALVMTFLYKKRLLFFKHHRSDEPTNSLMSSIHNANMIKKY